MSIANKLLTIAENIPRVYNSGVTEGYREGAKYQHKSFWDNYQDYGKRSDYTNAFSGKGWTNETFKPIYKIYCGYMAFKNSMIEGDLVEILNSLDVELDSANSWSYQYTFEKTRLTRLGYLKMVNAPLVDTFRDSALLETIDGLEIKESIAINSSFVGCTALKNLTMYGTVGQNFNLGDCPLSKASITSVYEHLSTTATAKTLTLKKSAVNAAFGIDIDDEATYPIGSEYYTLRHSKDNWTVSYI